MLSPDAHVEIPAATKRRLGLDDECSWIVLTESNRFVWPGPDVRPIDGETGYYGALPPALFDEVKAKELHYIINYNLISSLCIAL